MVRVSSVFLSEIDDYLITGAAPGSAMRAIGPAEKKVSVTNRKGGKFHYSPESLDNFEYGLVAITGLRPPPPPLPAHK